MMKATLLLLIAFLAVALTANLHPVQELLLKSHKAQVARKDYGKTCTALSCVKTGESCGTLDMGNDIQQTGCINVYDDTCNITTSGTGYSEGTCLNALTVGQRCGYAGSVACNAATTCAPLAGANYSVCTTNKIGNRTQDPGQPCDTYTNCNFRTVDTFTTENVCNNGVCKFVADGQPCNYFYGDSQCNYLTSACVATSATSTNYVCRALVALNGACNTSSSADTLTQCQSDLYCVPNGISTTAGTCMEPFSQKEDGACTEDDQCEDGVCADKTHEDYLYGVCTDYIKTSTLKEACVDDNDCTASNGETCNCDTDGESRCVAVNMNREVYQLEVDDCLEDTRSNCLSSSDDAAYTKCVYDSCKKPVCKYYKELKDYGYGSCEFALLCDASSLFASLPLLAIAAVIVMLFQ